ncbi:MAG: hypothetical protein OXR62_11060 [Ahrensia sp.]|nr:hypothetical protein [Ahrensia sp.]
MENLQKIADAGDVSIEWLLTGVEAAEQVIDAESDTKPRDGAGEVDWEVWERAYQLTSEWERMMYERGEGRMHIEDTVRMARMHYDRLLREKSKE